MTTTLGSLQGRMFLPALGALMLALAAVFFSDLIDHRLDSHDVETFRDHVAAGTDISYMLSDQREQQSGRPVSELVKWLWYLIWGNDAGLFHLFSIGLHVAVSLQLATTYRLWGADRAVAAAAAVLFLVQTAHYEPVHHISLLDYPLAMIFSLLTVAAIHRTVSTSRPVWLGIGTLAFVLGLLSHPGVVSIVPVLFLQAWSAGHNWRKSAVLVLPMVAVALVTLPLAMRATSQQTNAWETLHGLGESGALGLVLGPLQTGLWLLSRLVTTAHWLPISAYRMQPWELYVGLATVCGLVFLAWRCVPIRVPGLWLLATLVPFAVVSQNAILPYLPAGPSRYVYFASAGSCLLLAWACWRVSQRHTQWHPWLFSVLVMGLVVSSYLATHRVEALSLFTSSRSYQIRGEFSDGIEQMRRAMDRAPAAIDKEEAYRRLSLMTMAQGLDAMPVIEEGLQSFPASSALMSHRAAWLTLRGADRVATGSSSSGAALAQAYHHMGTGFNRRQDLASAADAYRAALYLQPERQHTRRALTATLANLSTNLLAQGQVEAALGLLQEAVGLEPERPQLLTNLGAVYHQAGRDQDAARALSRALALGASEPAIYWTLAELYRGAGKTSAAADVYENLLVRHSELDAEALTRVGIALDEAGRPEPAERAYRQALQQDPDQVSALTNLGWILHGRGRLAEAIDCYRGALSAGPHSVARFNLALAYVESGDIDNARLAYETGIQQHGAFEAVRIGAVADLERVAAQQNDGGIAQTLLSQYWPQQQSR